MYTKKYRFYYLKKQLLNLFIYLFLYLFIFLIIFRYFVINNYL